MLDINKKEEYSCCKVCSSKINLINEKYNLVECINCKLVFSKTIFTNEDFIETYNKLYNTTLQYNTHQQEFKKLKQNSRLHIGRPKLKIINYLLKNNKTIICEIGAGVGIVASFFKNKNVDYLGIELDKETVEKAQSIGLNVINGDFSVLKNSEKKFDAIIAFEVIEHLQDVNSFFEIVSQKLSNNGYIGFTVPNYNKRNNYINPGETIFQSGPPIHLNFFTTNSIYELAKLYNFEIIFCKTKKFPYFNWKKRDTYRFILKAIVGKFNGQTIQCLMIKN